jgi:CRISPR-associated protein Cas2
MAESKLWYLIAYDIRDAKRLYRVAKHLNGYGNRLQYSVFRCRLSERQLERLQWELAKLLAREDDLLIIGLCGSCARRAQKKGKAEEWSVEPVAYEIV